MMSHLLIKNRGIDPKTSFWECLAPAKSLSELRFEFESIGFEISLHNPAGDLLQVVSPTVGHPYNS